MAARGCGAKGRREQVTATGHHEDPDAGNILYPECVSVNTVAVKLYCRLANCYWEKRGKARRGSVPPSNCMWSLLQNGKK